MTPKEKAQDLFNKFQHQVSRNGHRKENVKECVMICIDEILKDARMDVVKMGRCGLCDWDYWNEVKKEVEFE